MRFTVTPPVYDDALAAAIARTGKTYDLLPYPSSPFPVSQPARLAGVARMLGLDAPPVGTARVLELGCAAGGNIIPLAARFPDAQFVGIELSRQQAAQGRARIARLGLTNVELQCRDLMQVGRGDGTFDYIIGHGVYSWVPRQVRDAILRIVGEVLSPQGIAYISYNVLPGWQMRQTIRDALILDAPSRDAPAHRVTRARRLLNIMKERSDENTVYGRLWRAEADRLANASDGYLGHDLLEDTNEPSSFTEFIGSAMRNGLCYLGEAELATMLPETFGSNVAQMVREICADDLISMEQSIDVVTGRPFRQTLLVHQRRAASIQRRLDPERMAGLHLVAPLDIAEAADPAKPGASTFADPSGRGLTTTNVAAAGAIRRMIGRLPASTAVDDLVTFPVTTPESRVISEAVFKMTIGGLLVPSTVAVAGTAVLPERPIASAIVVSDAASGAASTVNARHEAVALDAVGHTVLPLLDGTHDRAALIAAVFDRARKGEFAFLSQGVRVEGTDKLEACAAEYVDRVLAIALRAGLLSAA